MPDQCLDFKMSLDAYHDGELQDEERELVEGHLDGCDACRRELASIRIVSNSLRKLPPFEMKIDLTDKLDQILAGKSSLNSSSKESVFPAEGDVGGSVVRPTVGAGASANCEQFIPLLDAYHDGELAGTERESVQEHVDFCRKCQSSMADIERVVTSLQGLKILSPRYDIAENFETILAKRKSNVVPFKRPAMWISASIAAGLALLVIAFNTLSPSAPNVVANSNIPAVVENGSKSNVVKSPVEVADNNVVSTLPQSIAEHSVAKGQPATAPVRGHEVRSAMTSGGVNTAAQPSVQEPKLKSEIAYAAGNSAGRDPQGVTDNVINKVGTNEVLANYDLEANPAEELGLSTDEDGLYAIKL